MSYHLLEEYIGYFGRMRTVYNYNNRLSLFLKYKDLIKLWCVQDVVEGAWIAYSTIDEGQHVGQIIPFLKE